MRDQQKADRSWTAALGRFTTYLALAAFFFGIGTFTDLRNRIVAPPPAPGQAAKDSFVKTLDQYCKSFVDVRPSGAAGTGWARIAADDQAVLAARNRMNLAWNTYSPTNLTARDAGAFESTRSYYFAASDLLQAAIGRAQAADLEGYARDIGPVPADHRRAPEGGQRRRLHRLQPLLDRRRCTATEPVDTSHRGASPPARPPTGRARTGRCSSPSGVCRMGSGRPSASRSAATRAARHGCGISSRPRHGRHSRSPGVAHQLTQDELRNRCRVAPSS